jgi:ABC-2 type transport system ATP-binding protein
VRFHNLLADIASDVVVILSTHIVSDVADLCANFAVIDKGRVLLTGDPGVHVAEVAGRIWRKTVTKAEAEALKAQGSVVSTRLMAGRTVVRAYGEHAPAAGFEPVDADLEDVYFCTIAGYLAAPAAQAA